MHDATNEDRILYNSLVTQSECDEELNKLHKKNCEIKKLIENCKENDSFKSKMSEFYSEK